MQPHFSQVIRPLQLQVTSKCNHMKDSKTELTSGIFPKFLTQEVLSKMKYIFLLKWLSFMGEFIIQQYNQDMTHWWLSGKEPSCQVRRHEFCPWVLKIPWRKKWKPTPTFLPEKSHGQRSLVGYSAYDPKKYQTRLSD